MPQSIIHKYIYALFLFLPTIGFILCRGFGARFVDEVCTLGLVLLFLYTVIQTKDWSFNRAFLITLGVFGFYICYSLWIESNIPIAIVGDLVVQIKPYLAFFCIYQVMPVLNERRKSLLKNVSLLFWSICLLPLGIASIFYGVETLRLVEHPGFYGIIVTIISLCYLYSCKELTLANKMVFILLMSIGLLCGRSKFYGFYTFAVFMILFAPRLKQFKWSVRNITFMMIMLAAITFVAWKKITLYFYDPLIGMSDVDPDLIARFVMYAYAPQVLYDYFPFGSGFASFATFYSGKYYSELYAQYGIDGVWGMSADFYKFITDTYYPVLAQFGVVGILLFGAFWVYVIRRAFRFYKTTHNLHLWIVFLLLVGFIALEETTDSMFTMSEGFFVMMLLGLVLSEMKNEQQALLKG